MREEAPLPPQARCTHVPRLLLGLVVLLSISGCARVSTTPQNTTPQDTLSTEPMLRLSTDMHSVKVNRIDSDAAGDTILTCSNDKTARLWDAHTGKLQRILRVPIAQGNEGKIYACALSPDGKIAALGGFTNHQSIYLFDSQSGILRQRLSGLENVVFDIEFDGNKRFAAGLGGANGIRLFVRQGQGQDFVLKAKDSDYGDNVYNLAFAHQGRLATVSYDGKVRLYDTSADQLHLLKKQGTLGGKNPYSLAFSPDASKLALGYKDSPRVEVLDGQTLELLYRPDMKGADTLQQSISGLTFGSDGHLYGGGTYKQSIDDEWWFSVRSWDQQGQGTYRDFPAAGNTIMDLKAMADGSILMAGTQPDLARFRSSGKRIFYLRGEVMDFTNGDRFNFFTVNKDGTALSFKPLGGDAQVFDLGKRQLTASSQRFKAFREKSHGVRISDWENSRHPKRNGQALEILQKYEACRAVDIGTDGTTLLGANWSVYALDPKGKKLWRTEVPGTAWAVKIAANGKVAVVAHNGGEILWYRMSDGAVLLSLYVHPDGKRWILSTPEGYYDASAGADTLMGWHINNGRDKAPDFYPIAKFRSVYYRPDVVAAVLEHQDVEKALAVANAQRGQQKTGPRLSEMRPPRLTILAPANQSKISSDTVTLRYQIENPSTTRLKGLKILMDGRPIEDMRAFHQVPKNTVNEITLPMPHRDVAFSLIAESRYTASEPATVHLHWQGKHQPFTIKPKLYVLAVGSSAYEDKDLRLDYAAQDARDFAKVMKQQQGGLYREVVVKLLTDPNEKDVMKGLEWIERQTTSQDVAAMFLAGHGVNNQRGNYYYLPIDVELDSLRSSAVSYADIKDTLVSLPGKVVLFLDTCHSGNIMGKGGKMRGMDANLDQIANDLKEAENGIVVFTSSTGGQYSLENSAWANGAFTEALVEGLSGKADYQKDWAISINELALYLSERVKELTQGRQTPTTTKPQTISDFPLVAW